MTIFDNTQSVEARDQMWSELRAAETQRVQWQQQANAAAAQAIGDFHQRAPYADPGVALAAGTASAAGTPSEPIAKAVDQSTADGNRPSWTAQESSGLVNAMRSAAGVPTQGQAHQATLRSIQAYGRANSDPLIRDQQGNVDQAATLKAAGVPQPGGAFNWASPTDYLASAGDNAMTGLKAVTRTGLTVAQSGWQEAQNEAAIATHNVGNVVSDVAAGDLSGAASGLGTIAAMPLHSAESFRATDVVQAAVQQKELGSADLGSGFFPGGTVHNTWQPAAAREVRGVIPGTNSAWTPGRAIAALVDQPGSKQYRILSGVIDGATQFVADPTVLLSDSLLASRAAAQLLEAAPKALEEAPEAEKALVGGSAVAAATTKESFVAQYEALQQRVLAAEKAGPWTAEQRAAYDSGDWKKFSQLRGYSADEINDYEKLLKLQTGVEPDSAIPYPPGSPNAGQLAQTSSGEAVYEARQAAKDAVQEAAKGVLVNAERPTAIPSRTDQLLQSDALQPFMSKLADTKDHLEVMQRLGPNAPPSLVSAVTHADNIDDVQAAIRNEVGLSIRSTDQIPGMQWDYEIKRQVKRALPGVFDQSGDVSARSLQNVPTGPLDGYKWDATPLEQRQTMDTMNAGLKTVNVPYETRAKIIGAVSDGFADGSKEGSYKALLGFSDAIKAGFKAGGMNEQLADYLGQIWRDNHTSLYGVDALGRPSDFGFMSTASGAQNLEMISPAKLSEGLGSAVEMPDFRQVRRLTSKFGRLILNDSGDFGTEGQKLKLPLALMQSLAEDVFPRLQVTRIATAVRVIGDEQAKLAAAGFANFATHPFQQFALVLGSSTDLERLGIDEHTAQQMLNEASGNFFNADAPEKLLRATRATGSWTDVPFNSPNGVQGGLDMAQQFYHDPISQFVAQGKTTDQIIDWLHGGEKEPPGQYGRIGLAPTDPEWKVIANKNLGGVANGLPAVPDGYVRMWRGQAIAPTSDAEFAHIAQVDQLSQHELDNRGRWFSPDLEWAGNFPGWDFRTPNEISYVDVPQSVADASFQPERGKMVGNDPTVRTGEHALPKEWADRAVPAIRADEQGKAFLIPAQHGEGLSLNGAAPGMSGPKAFNEYVKLGANAVARDTTTGNRVPAPVDLTDDNILRGWIDHNIRGQVDDFSKGNTELRNAIGYNKVGVTGANEEVGVTPGAAFLDGQTTPEFEQQMRDWSQHPDAPERVKWNVRVADRPDAQTIKNMWMKTSGQVMNALFTKPIKMLDRSPFFRSEFYNRVAELAPQLKPSEANNLLKAIEANATDQGFIGKIAEYLGGNKKLDAVINAAGKANGDLTVADVFGYAKGHAIDTIHDTLFNVQKTNLEQSLRSFTPFVHAWREVLGTWMHLITQNPGIVRKMQMTIQGARDAGWFYTDPVSGEQRFNIPGSDWLTHQFMGGAAGDVLSHVPVMGQYFGGTSPGSIPLGGNVKDLNIVSGTFLPGFGPMVQAPAAAILKNIPQADFVSGLLTPYGVPSEDNAPFFGKAGAYVLPGWLQKVVSTVSSSPDSASAYGNQYLQMVQQLMASGQYGTSPPEQQRLTRDAQNKAKLLTVLRGLGQFVSPASPSYDPKIAAGPDGADVLMSQLAKEYHTMQSEDYSTATQRFIDTFGEGPFVAAMSRTKSVNGGLDASTEFGNWERDHGGTLQSYPDVGAYFAPIGSDFDSEVYQRQQQTGERKKLTGPQIVEAAQSTIAKWKYAQYQKMLGARPTVAQLNWLTTQKDQLKTQYPGYATDPGNPQDFSTKVEQLKRATTDPDLNGNIQTALATYLYLRDQALGVAQKRAGGKLSATLSSDKDADLRAWLAGQANNIINKYPDFGRMYTNVLSSEVG